MKFANQKGNIMAKLEGRANYTVSKSVKRISRAQLAVNEAKYQIGRIEKPHR